MRYWLCWLVLLLTTCGRTAPPSVDLDRLVIQDGDLPPGMDGGQIRELRAMQRPAMPAPVQAVYQEIRQHDLVVGNVLVALYASVGETEKTYADVAERPNSAHPDAIGEQATLALRPEGPVLVFTRCHALATVQMLGVDAATLSAYAQRLDHRLAAAIC